MKRASQCDRRRIYRKANIAEARICIRNDDPAEAGTTEVGAKSIAIAKRLEKSGRRPQRESDYCKSMCELGGDVTRGVTISLNRNLESVLLSRVACALFIRLRTQDEF